MRGLAILGLALALAGGSACAQVPAAVSADPPIDAAHPAAMAVVHIPTHGVEINGVLYTAAGAGPHPTLVLLHGFPGNEQNLDLAQAVRRAGWNVLTLHYRGSWGSPGSFSFHHVWEDAQVALDYVRQPAIAAKYGIDARKVALAGHSMGGMAAAMAGARNPGLAGVALISAADFGVIGATTGPDAHAKLVAFMADDMESLAGTSPSALADEAAEHAKDWSLLDDAKGLAAHPLLIVTSNDGLAASNDRLEAAVKADGGQVTALHLPTDHSYSDQRIALESAVVRWLALLR